MKRVFITAILFVLISVAALPAAAQAPRAPVIVDASTIDDASDAHPFHPNVEIIVSDVQDATIEGSEPDHTCSGASDANSVWFQTELQPGTLTLDTSGSSYGASSNTVISLYRVADFDFLNFGSLTPVSCNDNGTGAGIISAFPVTLHALYYIQVSAAQGTTASDPSTVTLKATYTAATPQPYDEPENARTLKFPSQPTLLGLFNSTLSLDEPTDPFLSVPITNTVWLKFTVSDERFVGFQDILGGGIWFSLYEKVGSNYVYSSAVDTASGGVLTAALTPGTYYLRVAQTSEPTGSFAAVSTFVALAYFIPLSADFNTDTTPSEEVGPPNLAGWKLKSTTPGTDGAFCDGAPVTCYFRFVSDGATEKTSLQSTLNLNGVKLKKGDIIQIAPSLHNFVGEPHFTVKLTLTNAAGATQSYSATVQGSENTTPGLVAYVPANFTPVKAKLQLKNKDTVPGNTVELDTIVVAAVRIGEGILRDSTLLPFLGGASGSTPRNDAAGVLPAPPPAQ